MRVMMVVRLANGFIEGLVEQKWAPTGTPAIAKMIEYLDRGADDLSLIMARALAPNEPAAVRSLRSPEKPISGLTTPIRILAEGPRGYTGIGYWLREALHFLQVWRAANRVRPDIIYVDRSNVLTGACLARFDKTPVVLRLMGVPPELRKILSGPQLARRIFRWAYRSPFAHVVSTLEGSRAVDFMEAALEPNVSRSVMLNGVDVEPAAGAPPDALKKVPKDAVVVTFLGRVEKLKGADAFVDALLALPDDMRQRVHGLIVGDGELAAALEKRVVNEGASDRITFTGPLSRDAVAHVLRRSDLYVSLNRQGHLSNATLEAIACGVPIVVQEIAGPHSGPDEFESLLPRQAYRAISADAEPKALTKLLIQLAETPEKRKAMRQAIEAFAEQKLSSWNDRIEREVSLLRDIANKDRA